MSFSEWKEVRLGDICKKIGSGVTPRGGKNVYKKDGIALIRSQNIYDFIFDYNGLAFIDDEQANKMKNVEVMSEDILLNITGDSVARCCIVPERVLPARVNQHVSIIRPKREILNSRYLQYLLIDYSTKELFLSLAYTGGTRKALTKDMIENLKITIPPIKEQKAIANTLSCLDDKVELNNRINKILEEMAQAIFKSWFVDFEPFQDGEFEGSELGRIPKGWRVGTLGEVCTNIFSGGTPSTQNPDFWNGEFNWLSSGETRNGLIIDTEKTITNNAIINSSTRLANKHDVVIASAGQGNTRGQTSLCMINTYINQSIVALRVNDIDISYAYLYYNLRNRYNELRQISDSSSIRGSLTTKTLKSLKIILPNNEVIQKYSTICSEMIEISAQNAIQNKTLTTIRDSLLPKLMSGEIRVPIEEVQ